ncbi:MAG: DegT/DnrJ/EryC1/StrS aminotransferase family protein [Deinococcales bacterium]
MTITTRIRARSEFLPFARPCLGEEEIAEVVDTLRSDWLTTGPKTKAFESRFAAAVDAPGGTSVMLNSCTAGLHLALAALGVGPGIDPDAVERAITPATRVVMPVHYGGHPADLDAIDALAAQYGLEVVEDAAHSAPSRYRGVTIGSRPTLAAFSFYATKNLTTAEGGALTGASEPLERARMLSLHGMSKDAWKRFDRQGSWEYDIVAPGYKCNMTDIAASLGLHQLARLPAFHARRQELARRYQEAFAALPELQPPTERPDVVSSWHLYVLRFHTQRLRLGRNAIIEELKAHNIGTSVHYRPVHMMSYYRDAFGYAPDAFPVARDAFERMVSLPLDPRLSDDDVDDVIAAVEDIVTRYRR